MSTSEIDRIYHLIAEHSGDVIWVLNLSTYQFTYVSSSVYQLLGYTPEEMLKKKVEDVLVPESTRLVFENISSRLEMFSKGDMSAKIMMHEVDHIHLNGSIVPTKVFTSFIPDETGNVDKVLGILRKKTEDPETERQLLEEKLLQHQNEELLKALDKAEESDRLKTVFLQNMAHEIRTPMNAILGFSDLLVANFDNKAKLEYYASIIKQRGNDLLDFINNILDLSKIEAGEQKVSFEKVDLNSLLSELNNFFQDYKKMKGKDTVKIIFHPFVNTSTSELKTDRIKLRQIFINLISNALKFTNAGSIEISCNLTGSGILNCSVSDTGIGIPQEQQQLIFNRFFQLNNRTNNYSGGTGLGLAIVKGLVELLGGEIKVHSTVGLGSTFSFTIRNQHQDSADSLIRTKVSLSEEKAKIKKKAVLVVEDDIDNAAYLMDLLSATGLSVHHVAFGSELMDAVKNNKIDLILLNIGYPEIEGLELIKTIKNQYPHIKIIAQTASLIPDDKTLALESGFEDVISKPVRKDQLYSKVGKFIQ
jgi:PAS domain S-box-containing protein